MDLARLESTTLRSIKFQIPNSKEAPNFKFRDAAPIGTWSLEFPWNLVLGIWNFLRSRAASFFHESEDLQGCKPRSREKNLFCSIEV
jgi:hypothetical protein